MTETTIERRFKDGYEIHVSIKRGTGTRDQDKISATVHGETQEKAEERAERAVEHMEELAWRVRAEGGGIRRMSARIRHCGSDGAGVRWRGIGG